MNVTAIVVAAGVGRRFNSKLPKLLSKINSVPIIAYSLKALDGHPLIKDIIVVINAKNKQSICDEIRKCALIKNNKIVVGGRKRQDSVRNGLSAINSRTDLVLIHDGARPLIDKSAISLVIKEAKKFGASVLGVPVKNTIKECVVRRASCVVRKKKALNRDSLWEIQTPQVFRKNLILKAYEKFGNTEVTDDASLVEKLGVPVKVVMGSYSNIKITTQEDLIIAKAILSFVKREA